MAERMRISAQRIGLMLTAFLMITLIGVFATFAAPIPAMRGVLAERAIASAAATGDPAAMKSALAEARPLLGVTAQKRSPRSRPTGPGLPAQPAWSPPTRSWRAASFPTGCACW